jgi:hypothetical protein
MKPRLAATLFALVFTVAVTAHALADTTTALPGAPLSIYVGQRGQIQAVRDGSESGIFFAPASQIGDAGFFLAFPSGFTGGDTSPQVFGFTGDAGPVGLDDYTPTSQSPATGSGTSSDPLRQVTSYAVGANLTVTQTTTYVNGSQQFSVHWDVHNVSGNAIHFKALFAGDFFLDGSDRGTGIYTDGPPRFIGGTNADSGNSGGFAEVTGVGLQPWSAYQALEFGPGSSQVWGKVRDAASTTGSTFDDTVVGESVDNAGGVEWDQDTTGAGLAAGATRSFELTIRNAVPALLQLTPSNAGAPRGVPINFTATAVNTDGVPYAGRTLRYEITGANPASASVSLDGNGQGTITDPGATAGDDTVVAFVDFNNDGIRQSAEPQASALGTFVDNVAPKCTVKVSGDRPGGEGGAGKPLKITVSCNEVANVSAATTLTVKSPKHMSVPASTEMRSAKIKLKTVHATVNPGQAVPIKLAIPGKVRRKYAGETLKAVTKATVRDSSGNAKTITATKRIALGS